MSPMHKLLPFTALLFLAAATAQDLTDCPPDPEDCSPGESFRVVLGNPRCIYLLSEGQTCTPLTAASTSTCSPGLFCRPDGVCGKATKGAPCSDDPTVCRDGLSCEASENSGASRPPSPLRVCKVTRDNEGAPCSVGYQYGCGGGYCRTQILDKCGGGMTCLDGFCSKSGESGWRTPPPEGGEFVGIGDACDFTEKICPNVTFVDVPGRLQQRELASGCIEGTCVSMEGIYPLGAPCGDSGEGAWNFWGNMRCVSGVWQAVNESDPFSAFEGEFVYPKPDVGEDCPQGDCKYTAVCLEGKCVAGNSLEGVGQDGACSTTDDCKTGLTCKNLYSRPESGGPNFRCASETQPKGTLCSRIPAPKDWSKLNDLQCEKGLECATYEFVYTNQRARCIKYAAAGEICGLRFGSVCQQGTECVLGTCTVA